MTLAEMRRQRKELEIQIRELEKKIETVECGNVKVAFVEDSCYVSKIWAVRVCVGIKGGITQKGVKNWQTIARGNTKREAVEKARGIVADIEKLYELVCQQEDADV